MLYYLLRVEPFTTLAIQLQGGKFDHADRMFFDLSGTWKSVLEEMSDVKELVMLSKSTTISYRVVHSFSKHQYWLYHCFQVPEMFYLPEAFMNVNSIDFGTTQQGGKLGMFCMCNRMLGWTHCFLVYGIPCFTWSIC